MSVTTAKITNYKKIQKQGFRARMATKDGRATLSRRRQKGRKQLVPIAKKFSKKENIYA